MIHFVWHGSPLRTDHASRIARFALANPAWRVLVWIDREAQADSSLRALANASSRAAGAIELMVLADYAPCFRHPASVGWGSVLVRGVTVRADASNLLRLEVVHLFGGIYMA